MSLALVTLLALAQGFRRNRAIVSLEDAAKDKASSGAFAIDAILFGRWRD